MICQFEENYAVTEVAVTVTLPNFRIAPSISIKSPRQKEMKVFGVFQKHESMIWLELTFLRLTHDTDIDLTECPDTFAGTGFPENW